MLTLLPCTKKVKQTKIRHWSKISPLKWIPPPVEKETPSLWETYSHDLFLFFINSTLSPTNTICHSPEDLKCRLKLHVGIKSVNQPHGTTVCTRKCCVVPQVRALLKLSSLLLPQGFTLWNCRCYCLFSLGWWSPASSPLVFLCPWSTDWGSMGQSHPAPLVLRKPQVPTVSPEMFSSFS